MRTGIKMVTVGKPMNDKLTIRKATKSDAVSIASIHSNTWKVTYKDIVPEKVLNKVSFRNRLEYFQDVLGTDKEETVVAVENGLVVGFMTFGEARDHDVDNRCAEIWGLYIDASYFNKGIGKSLILWAENELNLRGYHCIYLWTLDENLRANTFYNSLGFCKDGNVKMLMGDAFVKAIRYYKHI